ncbi:hypothetical protein [Hymenobacter sp. GOD-10R]|uniref:hypothetical protein n=1 Tax=Hymenobacter sp. GOD-10R TaxID=3093922 RepID=UPI002D79EAAB|nr:hypothetical protein [Hymenobacter sp. GOD-10R]WRQ31802.1 hypothetical protein SD425_28555 [Hymenobacter sp. GOD-10R]
MMTNSSLQSLGFVPTTKERNKAQPTFDQAWRYRHEHQAQDGTLLFIEHPFGISVCRLSEVEAPLDMRDVVATVPLLDQSGLETAVKAFFTAHGGRGALVAQVGSHPFRPYRLPL